MLDAIRGNGAGRGPAGALSFSRNLFSHAQSSPFSNQRPVSQRTVGYKARVDVESAASLKVQNPHAVPVNTNAAPAPAHHWNVSGQSERKLDVVALKLPVSIAIDYPGTLAIHSDLICLGSGRPFAHDRRISRQSKMTDGVTAIIPAVVVHIKHPFAMAEDA
jgi:hypothetical protein